MNKQPNDPSSPTPPTAASDCQPKDGGGAGCSAWLGDVVAQLKLVHFIHLHGLRDDLEDYLSKIRGI